MQYEKAIKQLKKISNHKDNHTEKLKGVYHSGNQLIATDSKRLVQVEVEDGDFEEQVFDVKNNRTIGNQFPNVEKVFIGEGNADIELHISYEQIVQLKNILACMKALKLETVEIYKEAGAWLVKPKFCEDSDIKQDDLNLQFRLSQSADEDEVEKKMVNVNYFKDMVDFMKETKEDVQMLMKKSPYHPIQFENESYGKETFKSMICPLRLQ